MSAPKLLNKPPAFHLTLVLATLAPLYIGSYQYRLHHPYGLPTTTHQPPLQPADTTTASPDFIRDWLSVHVVEPFNPSAIAAYCNQTRIWDPNLVFNLADANGGIGNIRGNFLDFLFYAVEAGASIMLPGMATRSEADLSNVWASRGDFDLMFDEEWFLRAWGTACPQMVVYKPRPGEEMVEPVAGTYFPPSRRRDLDAGNSPEGFREHLGSWLKQQDAGKGKGDGEGGMVLVNVGRTLWEVDTRSLPPGFRRNFGQLLRINPDIRRLAAMVVEQLARERQLIIDPRHGLRTLYVSSGSAEEIARFVAKAAAHTPPLTVVSKHSLLPPQGLRDLEALTWDQQALVDYEVLQRASVFAGFVKSSFSYNIAMTRAQWGEDRGRVVEPWSVLHEEIGVAFDDGVSRVVGRDGWHEARIPRGMWP
ncbi:hypothetical protein D0861_08535 [Hortaea werneckii]|uniref:Uncharacterized protein n=1 Tax=Hortaea werneckii TaxID=91943 RepID=A0A3M7EW02_HORWE|nr:hypothetical protein D0861_08535 [Hortaea werneckii]